MHHCLTERISVTICLAATENESGSDSVRCEAPLPRVQRSTCCQRQCRGVYVAEQMPQAAFPTAAGGAVEGASPKSMQLWYKPKIWWADQVKCVTSDFSEIIPL